METNPETPTPEVPKPREFANMRPRKWQNKTKPEIYAKVLPWFQPLDDNSRMDFKGLISELEPGLKDHMKDFNAYSGLVLHIGWMVYTEQSVWWGMPLGVEEQFNDLGYWDPEVDGKGEMKLPSKDAP